MRNALSSKHSGCKRASLLAMFLVALSVSGRILPLHAAETELENGVRIPGTPIPIQELVKTEFKRVGGNLQKFYPILMIDDPMRRYFIPARQVKDIDFAGAAKAMEEFEVPQKPGTRRRTVGMLGAVNVEEDFDRFGRRTVSVNTADGKMPIVQGITKLTPHYLSVTAMTELVWDHAIATTSLKAETLDSILRRNIDTSKVEDRLGIAQFYLQAGFYLRAAAELDRIAIEFPELKETVTAIMTELNTVQADQLLAELRLRRKAGQHDLVADALLKFPRKELSAAVLKSIDDFQQELRDERTRLERVKDRLSTLQQTIPDENLRGRLESMRSIVRAELDYQGLPRMEAFLNLEADPTLDAKQKLSLAYSGWLMGSAGAVTELDRTLNYWSARTLVREILRTREVNTQKKLLAELSSLESISVPVVAKMLNHLPPILETPNVKPGVSYTVTMTDAADGSERKYHVLLPHEYSPNHSYPAIVALHPEGRPADWELLWWGGNAEKPGQAQRRGYIVIAPEYCDPDQPDYDYGARAHEAVQAALVDASQRFHIDRDRVFLSGHGRGGDAAFDIGMSHPDWFAGVIPITGRAGKVCKWYWQNASTVSWYIVSGELARSSLFDEEHRSIIKRMMKQGFKYDMIVTEYKGRGFEHYYAEIHRIFDWMDMRRRGHHPWMDSPEQGKWPTEIDAQMMRPGDNELFWIRADKLPKGILAAAVLAVGQKPVGRAGPIPLKARITDGKNGNGDVTTIHITSGAAGFTLQLSPDLIDYTKRLNVMRGGRRKFSDFPDPQLETLLTDFRDRADRQKMIWTRVVIE